MAPKKKAKPNPKKGVDKVSSSAPAASAAAVPGEFDPESSLSTLGLSPEVPASFSQEAAVKGKGKAKTGPKKVTRRATSLPAIPTPQQNNLGSSPFQAPPPQAPPPRTLFDAFSQHLQQQAQQPQAAMPPPPINMDDPHALIRDRLERMVKAGVPDLAPSQQGDYHRTVSVSNILRNLRANPPGPKPAAPTPPSLSRGVVIIIDDVAIGKLLPAEMKFPSPAEEKLFSEMRKTVTTNVLEARGCHFCVFECDWGVKDPKIQLPRELATGTCNEDKASTSEFYRVWCEIDPQKLLNNVPGNTRAEKEKRLRELDELESGPLRADDPFESKEQKFSKIDGEDITHLQGYLFCRDCLWTQIDPTKTRICKECRHEKLAIIGHGQHLQWCDINIIDAANIRPNQISFREQYREISVFEGDEDATWMYRQEGKKCCMICTQRATNICANCPLKVCETCKVILDSQCGGWLDKLIYHHGSGRAHIRNDAFLLRSDNGGY